MTLLHMLKTFSHPDPQKYKQYKKQNASYKRIDTFPLL